MAAGAGVIGDSVISVRIGGGLGDVTDMTPHQTTAFLVGDEVFLYLC
jgi:hypothetical protein